VAAKVAAYPGTIRGKLRLWGGDSRVFMLPDSSKETVPDSGQLNTSRASDLRWQVFALPERRLPYIRLRSDDLTKKVIQLGPEVSVEAWPETVLFLGEALDFPGSRLGNVEGEVAFVAPFSIRWQVVHQHGNNLPRIVPITNPVEGSSFSARQLKLVHSDSSGRNAGEAY
jgi:hypothetical protein